MASRLYSLYITGRIKKLREYQVKDIIKSVLIGLPGTFFYYVFYYAGAARMLASEAFIVNYLWPIMSIVFACIILRERFTPRKIIAVVISFLGVVIVTSGGILTFDKKMLTGALLCVGGAVCYGIFTSLNKKYQYDKCISMMLNYATTFVITTVINAFANDLFLPNFKEALGFFWNGTFTMAIANTVWIGALQSGNTAKISNLAYITPFLSLVWTSLVLKEPFSVNSVLGLVVIVIGIFIQLGESKKKVN